ncbi:acetylglutamate kinase [Anaerocolumna sp. AGMB13025]|uniref:acetylglutamate kinase n=1 Tax=Anaerocolumna sp. AGMB13025 TaxID=3039116 RepID=UPI00241ECBB0|nr:acetylglutamate kinase [Anaerocolumna sp. AGMB13025]WFR55301.1 acetylglutamate kinase [Anaerocolumna sp. AGMB13025]
MQFNNNILSSCKNQITVFNMFRKLWAQHVFWTRSFIVSTTSGLDDLATVTERLLRSPTDFAVALRNFYGAEKARTFEGLFKEHILIAESLINNTRQGNSEEVYEDRRKWYKNAEDICIFLREVNPYWSARQFRSLFYEHLKMIEEAAVYRLNGRYGLDVKLFESIETQAFELADFMAYGILNQFFLSSAGTARQ